MFLNLTVQRQNERRIVVSHLMKFDIRFGSEDEGTEHKGNVLCVLVDGVPGCPTPLRPVAPQHHEQATISDCAGWHLRSSADVKVASKDHCTQANCSRRRSAASQSMHAVCSRQPGAKLTAKVRLGGITNLRKCMPWRCSLQDSAPCRARG